LRRGKGRKGRESRARVVKPLAHCAGTVILEAATNKPRKAPALFKELIGRFGVRLFCNAVHLPGGLHRLFLRQRGMVVNLPALFPKINHD
jgi:hypothetical protein